MILLTADSRSETMQEAANLGATEYVLKPFAPERLMKSIHQFCRGQMVIKDSSVEAREVSVAAGARGRSRRLQRQVQQRQRTDVETGTRADRAM